VLPDAFEATGHTVTDSSVNIIENFSEIRNNLDLTRLEEIKHEPPVLHTLMMATVAWMDILPSFQ
jgi:hypothetical protein